jgi:hypothetical protein
MNTTASTTPTAATAATTSATAARTAPAASSLAASAKFKTFAITFSTLGPLAYCIIQFFNWPLVTFHPATNRLVWGYEGPRPGEGPNMLWYGWTLTALIVLTVVGIVAMMLSERVTRRIPLNLVWVLPILAIPYIIYSLMPWWVLASK